MFFKVLIAYFILSISMLPVFFALDASGAPTSEISGDQNVRLRIVFFPEDFNTDVGLGEVREPDVDYEPLFDVYFNEVVNHKLDEVCTEFVNVICDYGDEAEKDGRNSGDVPAAVKISQKKINHSWACCDFLFDGWVRDGFSIVQSVTWPDSDEEVVLLDPIADNVIFVTADNVSYVPLGEPVKKYDKLNFVIRSLALVLMGVPFSDLEKIYYNNCLYEPVYNEVLQNICKEGEKENIEGLMKSAFNGDFSKVIFADDHAKLRHCEVMRTAISWFKARPEVQDEMSQADWLSAVQILNICTVESVEREGDESDLLT